MKQFPNKKTRKKYYEKEGKEHYQQKLYGNPSDWIHQRLKNINLTYLKESLKIFEKVDILDIGCAEGFYLREMASLIKKGVGLDIASNKIQRAKKLSSKFSNLQFIEKDFLDYKTRPESFDLIFSIEALEHIPQVKKCLKKIYKFLKKNGIFICSIPTTKERLSYKELKNWQEVSGHLYHWSKKDFLLLLKSAGFKIRKTKGIDNVLSQITSRLLSYFLKTAKRRKLKKTSSFKKKQEKFSLTWGAKIFYQLDNLFTSFPLIKNYNAYNIFVCQKK